MHSTASQTSLNRFGVLSLTKIERTTSALQIGSNFMTVGEFEEKLTPYNVRNVRNTLQPLYTIQPLPSSLSALTGILCKIMMITQKIYRHWHAMPVPCKFLFSIILINN